MAALTCCLLEFQHHDVPVASSPPHSSSTSAFISFTRNPAGGPALLKADSTGTEAMVGLLAPGNSIRIVSASWLAHSSYFQALNGQEAALLHNFTCQHSWHAGITPEVRRLCCACMGLC